MRELGEFFGGLAVICYTGTILNYIIKALNRKFGKKAIGKPKLKKSIGILMNIFVKHHKFFGFSTVIFLLIHFSIQYSNFGLNISGAIAASLIILQVLIGMYGTYINKKRTGLWLLLHRILAVLIILGIVVHIA